MNFSMVTMQAQPGNAPTMVWVVVRLAAGVDAG